MPAISVIVPVYNAEKDLDRSINSVLTQTFTDFELILVDDGSKDSSAKICDDYAQKDSRVKVFHKENGGVSSARNFGIDRATGEYITFLDADDYFQPEFIDELLSFPDQPLIVGGFGRFGEKEDESKPEDTSIVNIKADLETMWNKSLRQFIFWYIWGKIYRTDIIKSNNLQFHEQMKYNEDNCFLMDYMSKIETFAFVSSAGYMHFFEADRASKYRMNFSSFKVHLDRQEESFCALESKNNHRYWLVRRDVHRRFLNCFLYNLLEQNSYPDYCAELSKFKGYNGAKALLEEVNYSTKRRVINYLFFKFPKQIGYFFRKFVKTFFFC